MTAVPAPGPAGTEPGRPQLALVGNCRCGDLTVTVRDRNGAQVELEAGPDGKAVVAPDGDWWLVKFRGQWRVQLLEAGEDPPMSGGGRRHREHQCAEVAARMVEAAFAGPSQVRALGGGMNTLSGPCSGRCGRYVDNRYGRSAEPLCPACRETLEKWRAAGPGRPPLVYEPAPDGRATTEVTGERRPAGHGQGLDGPACREQALLVQLRRPPVRAAGCVRCGRVTDRVDSTDGAAWCGGDLRPA